MTVYNFTNALTSVFEAGFFFMLFNAFLTRREKYAQLINVLGVVALATLIVISNSFFTFGVLNAVGIIGGAFLASFLFKGRITTRLILVVFGIFLAGIVEIIVLFIIAYVGNVSATDIVNSDSMRLFGAIISKLVSYSVFKVICLKKNKNLRKSPSYWIMFLLVFSTSVLTLFLFFNLSHNNPNVELYYLTIICAIGLLASMLFVLYLYEHMAEQSEIIARQQIFEQQIKDQSKHLNEIMITQNKLRTFKHDLSNHLIALKAYFENQDNPGGINYLNNIGNMIDSDKSKIETGNLTFDAIINSKKDLAESKQISFVTNIRIPECIPIEPTDICIIFGNALDNAIEACDRINNDLEKFISLTVIYNNNSIYCKISNSCPENTKVLDFETSKRNKNNHGFGISNIKTALSKYKNEFDFELKDNEFTLSFIIFE